LTKSVQKRRVADGDSLNGGIGTHELDRNQKKKKRMNEVWGWQRRSLNFRVFQKDLKIRQDKGSRTPHILAQ